MPTPARLIIIDTSGKGPPQPRRNGNAYTDDHDSVAGLKKLADKFALAILVVHHLRKMPAPDPLEAVSGTLGLTGCCDGVLVLNRRRGQSAGTLNVMGRDVEERELAVRFDSDSGLWKFEGESAPDSPSKMGSKRQEIVKCLTEFGPMTPAELSAKINRDSNAVRQLLYKMKNDAILRYSQDRYAVADNTDNAVTREEETSGDDEVASNTDNSDNGGGCLCYRRYSCYPLLVLFSVFNKPSMTVPED